MALTIPDVEKWKPEDLTAAGKHAGDMSAKLDSAENDGIKNAGELKWNGAAGAAANTRMTAEQARASKVSQALQALQKAFNDHADNLKNAKDKVIQLRDQAQSDSKHPGLEVNADGTVSAAKRIAQLGNASDRVVLEEELAAAQWEFQITNALRDAETLAGQAKTDVSQAATSLDTAFNDLGDPKAEAPTAPKTQTQPATTVPQSTDSPTTYVRSNSGSPSSNNGSQSHWTPSVPHMGTPMTQTPIGPMPSGDVADWIKQAKEELIKMGYSPDDIDERALALIIEKESGGNPQIVNQWDSNWVAGHPSKGLMQTIDSTFNAYKAPGHDDIYNPVDNIIAGTRYAIATYGSLKNVPGVKAVDTGGSYVGY
ncbi:MULTISPECIES: transglycosylase SLT domain-containing protein [unclassified Nocardia]|uniref:transglycosylase SLT domain-containing protein n=1 Tax=unclassified Nocardia TaxID=2637762 RepID=UPI001CE48208|nr:MULTISPECIES: transglycosylase SLT domain-containing protein [unclassified Nocardia]